MSRLHFEHAWLEMDVQVVVLTLVQTGMSLAML